MNRINEKAEYTMDMGQVIADFFRKWPIWVVSACILCLSFVTYDYLSQKKDYKAYLSSLEIYSAQMKNGNVDINNGEQMEPIDPVLAEASLSEAERDSVDNALAYYEVVQDRKEYKDNSAFNQLDATNAKSISFSYRAVSDTPTRDLNILMQYFQSEEYAAILSDIVKEYKKEYVGEVITVGITGDTIGIAIWLPESADSEAVFSETDKAIKNIENNDASLKDVYVLASENYLVKHQINQSVTNNILNTTNNYISALNTLNSYLAGMSDKALAVYYSRLDLPYYSKDVRQDIEVKEPEKVKAPIFKIQSVAIGLCGGLVVCMLIFLCIRILGGRIYSRAIKRNMVLDYSDDLWIIEKNRHKEEKNEHTSRVIENLTEIANTRKICLMRIGEIRSGMEESVCAVENSVTNSKSKSISKMILLDQSVLSIADTIEDRETEIVFILDIKKIRYSRIAQVVYEFNNLGFKRLSCICLH